MNRLFCAVCCFSLASLPALAQTKAAKSGMTDQKFVDMAAQTDMIEAHLGQMAQSAASSQAVKDYAQMLVTDHTADYQHLQNVAQQAGLTVPTAIDAEHYRAMIAPFTKLKGAAFDRKYAHEMVAGHTQALAVFKKESTGAQNQAIQAFAQADIPVLQKHLDGAKDLSKPKAAK